MAKKKKELGELRMPGEEQPEDPRLEEPGLEHQIDLEEVYRRTGIVGGRLPIVRSGEDEQ
jgi:hypothetical protein